MSERSIELKVGILIIASLAILGAFILVMGGFQFGETFDLVVDFNNPGGVQVGAPVKISSYKVGQVRELRFMGGRLDPSTGRRVQIRIRAAIETKYRDAIREDAEIYVTAQGVLGEQYLEIDPGTRERPAIRPGTVVRGIDAPRFDLFVSRAYELLDALTTVLRENRDVIDEFVRRSLALLKALNELMGENGAQLASIIRNAEELSAEAVELVKAVRGRVDSPEVDRILASVDRLSGSIARDIDPILSSTRSTLDSANRIAGTVGPEEQAQVRTALRNLSQVSGQAQAAMRDVQAIVARMRRGEGTVGALLADEEIYDDLKELLRELKTHPWRFFWRE
ncbi:MAG: MCE family protein [Deltaproteobacteria bacterium]|nr:MCE family protein [Deltaproteobacteria bacterium]